MAERKFIDQTGLAKVFALVAGKYATLEQKKTLDDAITLLNNNDTTEGSVAYAVKAEKDRIDGIIGTLSQDPNKTDAKTVADAIAYALAQATALVDGLNADFTGTKAVASTSGHVTVGVKEEKGVITSLTVADDDVASKDALDTLTTYVGTASKAETTEGAGDAVAATGLTKRIETLETAVGAGGSVDSQIEAKINALDATVRANLTDADAIAEGKKVGVKVVEEDGKVTGVTVVENDIASAALLGVATDTKDKATAFGYIAKEVADRTDAIAALDATVKANVVEEEGKADSVSTSDKVGVKIVEVDGKLTSVEVVTNDIGSAADLTKLQNVVGYTELSTDTDSIQSKSVDARLKVIEGADTVAGSVAKALKDAKDYADGLDTAMDARVDALEATHAKVGGEGDDKDNFKTVAQEILAVTGTPDSGKTLQGEIDDVEAYFAGLQTSDGSDATTVQAAINSAVASAGHLKRTVVEALPTENIDVDTIYMILNAKVTGVNGSATSSNAYVEYMYINSTWEIIGTTDVDLSDYQKSADLVALTDKQIDNLFNGKELDAE